MRLALVLVLGLLCALGASAQGGLSDARRCATPEPTLAQAFSTARIVEQYRMATALGQRRRAGSVTVPVAVSSMMPVRDSSAISCRPRSIGVLLGPDSLMPLIAFHLVDESGRSR